MPNNSCTVILNGHGFYTSTKVISLGATTINYNIIFPCGLRESISAAHHNLIMGTLAFTNPILQGLALIEKFTSTTIVNRTTPLSFITNIDHSSDFSRVSSIVNEHVLTNAPDVVKAHSLMDFDQQPTSLVQNPPPRFLRYKITHVPNLNNPRVFNDTLHVEFDNIQIYQDVINAHRSSVYGVGSSITLSANNLLCIKPTAPRNTKINFLLSDLINDILPKLKIVTIYHPTNNVVDIVPTVFLDDNSDNTLQQQVMATFVASASGSSVSNIFGGSVTFGTGDVYHELTIAGDANIVWDACRDLIE